jgi:hypothetical protein
MTHRTFVIGLLTCWLTAVSIAAESREPKLSLKHALAKAEKYVADKKLNVSDLFLVSVYQSNPSKKPEQHRWTVIWAPKDPNLFDGELRVYIYDDGRIEHGGSA